MSQSPTGDGGHSPLNPSFDEDNKKQYITSLDEALEKLGYGKFQNILMVLCGMCWAADGCEAVLLSFLIPTLQVEWGLPAGIAGTLGATVFLGVFIGAQLWGGLSDRYGRRFGYMACSVFTGVFGLASAFAGNFSVLIVLRLLTGIGLGGGTVAFSLFAEYLPHSRRGKGLIYNQTFWTVGCVLEVFLAWCTLKYNWRLFVALSAVPLWIIAAFYPILPESPRYYLVKGRVEDAERVLNQAALKNNVVFDPPLKLDPPQRIQETESVRQSFKKLIGKSMRRESFGVWILWFCDAFVYYGIAFLVPRYFITESTDVADSFVSIFLSTLAEFPSIPISLFGMDKYGRKKMIVYSFIMTGLFLPLTSMTRSNFTTATLILVIVRMHIATAYLVSYVYTTEIYPTVMRTTGLGVASSVARIGGVATSYISNDLSLNASTSFVTLAAGIAAFFCWLLLKETTHTAIGDFEHPQKHEDTKAGSNESTPAEELQEIR